MRVLPKTTSGVAAITGSPMGLTTPRSSGGGAAATAQDIEDFENAVAEVEAALVASGVAVAEAMKARLAGLFYACNYGFAMGA